MNMLSISPFQTVDDGPEFRPLFGLDQSVANWAFAERGVAPFPFFMAVGVVNRRAEMKGAIVFTNYSDGNAEVHYVGPGTLRRNIVRVIMDIAVHVLKLNSLTTVTTTDAMARGVAKIGALYQGDRKRFFDPSGKPHIAKEFIWHRPQMERLAGKKEKFDVF